MTITDPTAFAAIPTIFSIIALPGMYMSWVMLDDNFPSHPKAIRAGRAAAYLFVCGLCYCRKFHTNGAIPREAVPELAGTPNPRKMIDALVNVGLWESSDVGFIVHDYEAIYKGDNTDEKRKDAIRKKRQEAGRRGGVASWGRRVGPSKPEANAEAIASANVEQIAQPLAEPLNRMGLVRSTSQVLSLEERRNSDPPLDVWFKEFVARYPAQGRSPNHLAETAFCDVIVMDPAGPDAAFAGLCQRLEGHIRSHQWRVKKMIPLLENYLGGGRHLMELPEHLDHVTDATSVTLSAAAKILGGQR